MGWDAVIFDEAHRMTPTAETFYRVGRELSAGVPNALFLTATPHRGDEWLFRELLHLVDSDVFPTGSRPVGAGPGQRAAGGGGAARALSPGPLHFLRRMKEELVDYDTKARLFKAREASNRRVPMSPVEQRFYDAAQDLVGEFFEPMGRQLAAMVYGKRAASSMHALGETLRRRAERMGTGSGPAIGGDNEDDVDEDARADQVAAAGSLDARAEKRAIAGLLADMASAGVGTPDPGRASASSKWEPMMGCLAENGIAPGSSKQLVVFTEYGDTADWLVGEFRGAGFTAERYAGDVNHEQRAKLQADFMGGRFEVIVSTDAGNEGIDLQAAHVLVNWDIPWSLVRLEQRMGRIHRIGQQHKVMLYNLVAQGTREGDAHWRLLERLVDAANELGGKMFDSLAAIMELARAETGGHDRLLHRLYGPATVPEAEFGIPSREEIERATNDYYTETSSLSSRVDMPVADTARHEDRIARVNPVIVERFLDRAHRASLIALEQTTIRDEGFYYISEPPGHHRCGIVEALGARGGKALVATRSEQRQQAIEDHSVRDRAAKAAMLGPSNPKFTALLDALRGCAAPDMWQGAVLRDRTVAEDYTLFVYECDIAEGSDTARGRTRPAARSWLIRVDHTGEAHSVSWEILPNLTAAENAAPMSLAGFVAEAAKQRAVEQADNERNRRADQLAGWHRDLTRQLDRLPGALTKDIDDHELRQSERRRIRQAIQARLQDAADAAEVTRGEVRRVGWAHVLAAPDPPGPEDADDEQADSEEVSMRLVTGILEQDGWTVQDVHRENRGYDLHAVRGSEQRCVEVKGRAGQASSGGVSLTGGELIQAAQLGDQYWLYVVDNCFDGKGRLFGRWQNPVEVFHEWLEDTPVYRLAGSRLKQALDQQGGP